MKTSGIIFMFIVVIAFCLAVNLSDKPNNNALKKVLHQTDYYLNLNGNKIEIITGTGDQFIVDPDSLEEFINDDNL